jgi:hypothetical protein
MNQPLRFMMAALATWRVTHLLAAEDGPADAVVRVRARAGGGRLGARVPIMWLSALALWRVRWRVCHAL